MGGVILGLHHGGSTCVQLGPGWLSFGGWIDALEGEVLLGWGKQVARLVEE